MVRMLGCGRHSHGQTIFDIRVLGESTYREPCERGNGGTEIQGLRCKCLPRRTPARTVDNGHTTVLAFEFLAV
eukprot:4390117-Pyramimonas_sp.AAC.1